MILDGILSADDRAVAAVLVTNGFGHRLRMRGERFAAELNRAGLATFLFDLLTPDEERLNSRHDPQFQSERLRDVIEWMHRGAGSRAMPIVVAATGPVTAGVVRLAAAHPDLVQAIVIGADRAVPLPVAGEVTVPALVITSDDDPLVRRHAEAIVSRLSGPKRLAIAEDFFSAAAGRLTARWLDEVLAAAYEMV